MLGVLNPVGGGDPIPLLKQTLIVGRRPSCDIFLDFANVSSNHCRLEYVNGYWKATDSGSRNGTKVNGERIDEKFVQPGDTIGFARHYFELQYTPEPDAVVPVEEIDPFAVSLLEKAGLKNQTERPQRQAERPQAQVERPQPQIERPQHQIERPQPQVDFSQYQTERAQQPIERPQIQMDLPQHQMERPRSRPVRPAEPTPLGDSQIITPQRRREIKPIEEDDDMAMEWLKD